MFILYKILIYIMLLFFISCSMNMNNIKKNNKIDDVEFKINKQIGLNINI
jgi:hypothetical protein